MSDKPQEKRACEQCKKLLPLIPENFPRVAGTIENFEFVCRPCKRHLANQAKMAELEVKAIDTFLAAGTTGGSAIPHTSEMLESLMNLFGGTNGFASLAMKQYFDSKPGSRLRNSLLEMVVRLAQKNTEVGGAKKPVTLLTEEELEEEIQKRLKNAVLMAASREVVDAHSVPASTLFLSDEGVERTTAGVERAEG